jgi:voltage-gated potassium channel
MKNCKYRVFEILEIAKSEDKTSKVFDWCLLGLIGTNIIAVVLESFNSLRIRYDTPFTLFETISVIIFTIEYLLRLWTSNLKFPKRFYILSVVTFIFSGMAIVDLLAFLPYYLPMFGVDLRMLRILRITRIFRIIKLGRYSSSIQLIIRVFKRSKSDLLVTVFVTLLLMILASTMMYYVENPVQPDKFPNILASAWWTVITLTTVGYGDVYPITGLGKFFGAIIALLGIGLVALPTGIISSGFIEEIRLRRVLGHKVVCPECGTVVDTAD